MTFAPVKPPKSWFEVKPPELTPTNKKYIGKGDDQGRIAAYYFTWDQCLEEGKRGECWKPEKSRNNYQLFHQGSVETAEGDIVSVGTVGAGGGHAPYMADAKTAAAVYADTANQRFIATLHEDEIGGYFLGSFVPEVTEKEVAEVRRSPLSADFRWRHKAPDTDRGGFFSGYDNIGPWLVTRPGFPLTRAAAAMTNHEPILTAPVSDAPCCTSCATKTAAAPAADPAAAAPAAQAAPEPTGVAALQVGVGGFNGFEDGPIGPQMDAMGITPPGAPAAAAPAGPDPQLLAQVESLETKLRELTDRVSEVEAILTGHMIKTASAAELIMNESNMVTPETFDTATFNAGTSYHTYENASAR